MSRIFKIASSLLGLVAFFMMFVPQVVINWASDPAETLGIQALVGAPETALRSSLNGTGAGLAGYILVGVAVLLILMTAFLNFFKEHEVLNYIVLGAAILLVLIGVILIFLIRKNFSDANGGLDASMGVGVIIAGVTAILSGLAAGIALVMDIAQ